MDTLGQSPVVCKEVVLFGRSNILELRMWRKYSGLHAVAFVERLSLFRSVHYQRFHSIGIKHMYLLFFVFPLASHVRTCSVLEIRNNRMDKCSKIILLGQTVSALLGHSFGEVRIYVHMCHNRYASTNRESIRN